ncbi:EamA family transporter [Opitutus sp. ER46]|uniref:EamA family transporter n=1 Tax=Opitutus sp. ER46 TaxID=2161864 RepID=UPI000D303624|nr:EamA family transporter [Opitutus sp. ER46]PTX99011.1 EamA family transporter [Opitutus sp. ER46]
MFLLLIVSFVWAFSFGLIKGRLAGVDPTAVATLRLALALLVFLPWLRLRGVSTAMRFRLAAIGAIQFGVMYVLYLRAFAHLQAYEVALFTITTPFFVTLLDGAIRRQFVGRHAAAALLSVAGAGVIVWQGLALSSTVVGVLLVQASNLCFAAGQLGWRHARAQLGSGVSDASVFALLYAGAFAASLAWSFTTTDWLALRLTWSQGATLAYLGVLASGVCFFWWNIGATRVNAGTLAAFNNAKIPLAVACSLVFFGESANVPRLLLGGALMAGGVWLAESRPSARR